MPSSRLSRCHSSWGCSSSTPSHTNYLLLLLLSLAEVGSLAASYPANRGSSYSTCTRLYSSSSLEV
eukprot:scaffold7806_cov250-Ochromonas_danica.AAC.12